jgi:hypothetical protein
MANQRKKGKRQVAFWVTEEEKIQLNETATEAGYDNLADWLRSLITVPEDPDNPDNKPPPQD